MRDLISAFAICNNVTPVKDDPNIQKALEVNSPQKIQRGTYAPNTKSQPIFEQDIYNEISKNR